VDPGVALEIAPVAADPQEPQRLPRAEPEAEVRGEGDRNVEVEDPLRDALVGVFGRHEQRKQDRDTEQAGGGKREDREVIP
jgi:hypothetical protein